MADPRGLADKVAQLWPHLDERARRLFAASEARQLGRGGVSIVSRACGLSRVTITKGLRELDEPPLAPGRVRLALVAGMMSEVCSIFRTTQPGVECARAHVSSRNWRAELESRAQKPEKSARRRAR